MNSIHRILHDLRKEKQKKAVPAGMDRKKDHSGRYGFSVNRSDYLVMTEAGGTLLQSC